jgi:multidrug transporter EmrE-like cation transporter
MNNPAIWGVFGVALACVLASCAAQLAMRAGMLAAAAQASAASQGSGGAALAGLSALYLGAAAQPLVWLGLFLYGLSAAAWLWVLAKLPVSTAYPLVSLGFVFSMAAGIAFLGESGSWLKLWGGLLIVLGVLLLCLDAGAK